MSDAREGLPQPGDSRFMLAVANWLAARLQAGTGPQLDWRRSESLIGDRGVRQTAYDAELATTSIRVVEADLRSTTGESKTRYGIQLIDDEGSVVDSLWSGGFRSESLDRAIDKALGALVKALQDRTAERRPAVRAAFIAEAGGLSH